MGALVDSQVECVDTKTTKTVTTVTPSPTISNGISNRDSSLATYKYATAREPAIQTLASSGRRVVTTLPSMAAGVPTVLSRRERFTGTMKI